MKHIILNEYFDKGLNRTVLKNEILDLELERVEELKKVGIQVEEAKETLETEQVEEAKETKAKKGK